VLTPPPRPRAATPRAGRGPVVIDVDEIDARSDAFETAADPRQLCRGLYQTSRRDTDQAAAPA
jgi:hypothetical protein